MENFDQYNTGDALEDSIQYIRDAEIEEENNQSVSLLFSIAKSLIALTEEIRKLNAHNGSDSQSDKG